MTRTIEMAEADDFCRGQSGAGFSLRTNYILNYQDRISDTRNPVNEEMKKDIRNLWKLYLEQSWLDEQCEQYDSSLLFINVDQHPELYEKLMEIGEQRTHFRSAVSLTDGDDIGAVWQILLSIGARLGDESAALIYFPGPDRELKQYFDERQPWRAHWREIWDHSGPSVERLSAAMDLVISLDENDIGFKMEWLVEHVCTFHRVRSVDFDGRLNPTDFPSCQTLINELQSTLDPLDRRLPFLDQFERVALEVGIFD